MEGLGIYLGYVLIFALSFGILFVVLRAWVYQPLLGMMERRRVTIARGLEDARLAADARTNAEADAEQIRTEAQTRAAQMIREATERAEKVENEVRAQTEAEMAMVREAVFEELEMDRSRMLGELRGEIIALAMAAAQKLLSENLDEQRQRALINEFFSGVQAGNVALVEQLPVNCDDRIEVTSALPLTEAERESFRRALRQRLGGPAGLHFHTDPAILGGIIIRVGDQMMDGSVAGQLQGLRQTLQ